jgi:hypothetical protein
MSWMYEYLKLVLARLLSWPRRLVFGVTFIERRKAYIGETEKGVGDSEDTEKDKTE